MKNRTLSLVVFIFLLFGNQICQSQYNQTDDAYLWLEEIEGEKALNWVKSQNAKTEKIITANPLFEPLRKKYLEIFNDNQQIIYPSILGDYVYNLWQDENNERGLWRRIPLADYLSNKSNWEVILDIDELSKKENRKWIWLSVTWLEPDNKKCLLALSDGGKDENEIREFNVETKEFVKDGFFFKESKGDALWIDENKVLISRNFGEGTITNSGYPREIKLAERGKLIETAKTIFYTDSTSVSVVSASFMYENKQHIFIYDLIDFYSMDLYYFSGDSLEKIECPKDVDLVGFYKNEIILLLHSDWNVNNIKYKEGSLISMDLTQALEGKFNIKKIFEPNVKSSYVSMITSKDHITVNIMENVQSKLINYELKNNTWIGEIVSIPQFGSIDLLSSSYCSNDYFFSYSSYLNPTALYYANGHEMKLVQKSKEYFSTENFEIQQFTAISKDGANIPYFIVHKKDMVLNGKNPTIVYAYGGFNYSIQPHYSKSKGIGWLQQGGVYVLANIRGGGEFGPSWHQAALKEKRQNAYNDFYAVAEDLIKRKITSPKYLGAHGESNGGLMAGVAFTQRPDLYNAVVIGSPLLDMKRYSKLLAGASWIGEYGNPEIPEEWDYIKKYSPYQNISKDLKYPEVFFITSTNDDRVHPGHARKMAAKMKDMAHPCFYYETIEGGHSTTSTNEQLAYLCASIYTYFNMMLNNVH